MTEADWLACTDPMPMLEFIRSRTSDHKLRDLTSACCLLAGANSLGEHTGPATRLPHPALISTHGQQLVYSFGDVPISAMPPHDFGMPSPMVLAGIMAQAALCTVPSAAGVVLLRDIFGNPIRPVIIDPAWLAWNNGTVVNLAQGIYDERAFDRMPILADALEDAGCHNDDILLHCRGGGEHVRGCWAVDLLLGKE